MGPCLGEGLAQSKLQCFLFHFHLHLSLVLPTPFLDHFPGPRLHEDTEHPCSVKVGF